MRLRRELATSLVVQGAGAASVLLATLWLGAAYGPQVQGGFNRAKSTLEFIGAFATFGLPQALFFHARFGRLGRAAALRWVLGSAALGLPIGAIAAWSVGRSAPPELALVAIAVAAFVAHGQLRALLLVRERATRFNLATALPQLLTLAGVVVATALAVDAIDGPPSGATAVGFDAIDRTPSRATAGADGRWFAIFAVAYGVGAAVAWRGVPRRFATGSQSLPALAGGLVRYGLAAWLTAALATASILAVQRWVEAHAGAVALGRFTMAMTLTQVPLTPIAYAAPLLFRRWTREPGAHAARRWSAALFAGLLGVAALIALASLLRDDLGLGPAYAGVTRALATLLAGGAAEAASRVLAVQANATGLPWIAVRAEAARVGVLLVAWAALPAGAGWLAICAAWSAGAIAAAGVLAWHGRGS